MHKLLKLIGKEFKRFRLSLKLSQDGLAIATKKDLKTISKIENAERDVRISTLMGYLHPLGYTLIIVPIVSAKTKPDPILRKKLRFDSDDDILAVLEERKNKRKR